jgi:hypothetical protein
MLLLNGKPVEDDFLERTCKALELKVSDFRITKTKKFRLTEAFFRKIRQREMKSNRFEERILVAPEYHIEPTVKWTNPLTGMTDLLTYTTNYLPDVNGRNTAAVEPVTFEYGWLTVNEGQADLYFFLVSHELNKTNPRYKNPSVKPRKPFTFTEALPDLEANDFVEYEKNVALVITMLTDKDHKKYVNDAAVVELAKSYGFGDVSGKGRNDINKFLITYAKKNPNKLLDDLTSAATEIRAILADAITFGVIDFDLPYVRWRDISKGKRSVNHGIIYQVPNGLDPMDSFVTWMREKDNSGVFNQLKKELEDKKIAAIQTEMA